MLDIAPSKACAADRSMSVDLTSYLLAASPPTPSSGYQLLSYAFGNKNSHFTTESLFELNNNSSNTNVTLRSRGNANLKPIIIKPDVCDNTEESETCASATSPVSPSKIRKQVSFADHRGLALATVRFLTEPSHIPPRLKPELIASLTKGYSAGVSEEPPLKLCFPQPASDYLAFRDRLEKNFVSLENVILKNYVVAGTMKVKNVSFEKRVFLRLTFDEWKSNTDVIGTYVPGPGEDNDRRNIFDTFSFEFDVPTTIGFEDKVEFAVGYETNHGQHWDNNLGSNYRIVSSDFKETEVRSSFVREPVHVTSWTQYACWNEVDTSTPYW